MGKVVTVMNMKGGVGKTTATINLASAISYNRTGIFDKYKKILMIDYDPQFNLSQACVEPKRYFELDAKGKTVMSVLQEDPLTVNPFVIQIPGQHKPPSPQELCITIYGNAFMQLDLLPSSLDLMYLAVSDFTKRLAAIEERFEIFINQCRLLYDLIFIDCHPAGSLFTKTSINNSDAVLMPVVLNKFASRGLDLMARFIEGKSVSAKIQRIILLNKFEEDAAIEKQIMGNPRHSRFVLPTALGRFGLFAAADQGRDFLWEKTGPYTNVARVNARAVAEDLLVKLEA